MSFPTKDLIFFISILISINFILSTRIHIFRNPVFVPRKGEVVPQVPDSKFTKICQTLLSTSENLGDYPFQIYNYCDQKYHFFGSDDEIIIKDKPFCYDNLEKVFCHIKIFDDDDTSPQNQNKTLSQKKPKNKDDSVPITDNSEPCIYEDLTGTILKTIQGCLKEDSKMFADSINNLDFKIPEPNKVDTGNICPSLNYNNFKIQNKDEFCSKAQRMEIVPVSNGGKELVYTSIGKLSQTNCKKIIDLYNLCIDTDYILYPKSNYKRCFDKLNSIYSCNIIKQFNNNYEKEMCSDYILPFVAKDYNKGNIKDIKEYCTNQYENKLTKYYDDEIANQNMLLNEKLKYIQQLNESKKRISIIADKTSDCLNNTSAITSTWLKFYPEFSNLYSNRPNITLEESVELGKLRNLFDQSFKIFAELERKIKEPEFLKSNFTLTLSNNTANLKSIDKQFYELGNEFMNFINIMQSSKNLKFNKNDPQFTIKFVKDDYISKEEIVSFKNEFSEMVQYSKNYMNYIMTQVKNSGTFYDNLIKESQQRLKEIIDRTNALKNKRNKMIKDVKK